MLIEINNSLINTDDIVRVTIEYDCITVYFRHRDDIECYFDSESKAKIEYSRIKSILNSLDK